MVSGLGLLVGASLWTAQAFLPSRASSSIVRSSSARFSAPTLDKPPSPLPQDQGDDDEPPLEHADAVICGGGPAGLLTAIMLAQKLPPSQTIRVYDRLAEPPSPDDETAWSDVAKFYLIGLGGRGQSALKTFNVWDEVAKRCVAVVGRKNWDPDGPPEGVERIFTKKDKKTTAQVLPRDKLVGVLHEYILNNYQGRIELNYGYEMRPIDFDYSGGSQVLVEISKCTDEFARLNPSSVVKVSSEEPVDVLCDMDNVVRIATDFLVAADGTVRTIANAMEKADQDRFGAMNPVKRLFAGQPFRVKRYVDDNQRVYKTIPIKLPSNAAEWRGDLNYSARSKGSKTTFDALPANANGEYCGALLLKKDDEIAKADTDPADLRQRLDEALPLFSAMLSDEVVETVAKKPVSYLPGFRYAGPRLHQGNRCLILGDCAHTVKPYFGLGANSALEDVKILGDILERNENDIPKSVKEFSKRQAGEAKALVRISRDLDRPGKLGLATFILPLILDSIFNGLLPRVFQPNIIAMLQRENYTFQQVGARKRLDRLGQVSLLGMGAWLCVAAAKFTVARVSAWTGLKGVRLWGAMVLTGVAAAAARRLATPILSPVMSRITNSRTHLTPLRHLGKKKDDADKSVGNGESFLTPLAFGNQQDEKT